MCHSSVHVLRVEWMGRWVGAVFIDRYPCRGKRRSAPRPHGASCVLGGVGNHAHRMGVGLSASGVVEARAAAAFAKEGTGRGPQEEEHDDAEQDGARNQGQLHGGGRESDHQSDGAPADVERASPGQSLEEGEGARELHRQPEIPDRVLRPQGQQSLAHDVLGRGIAMGHREGSDRQDAGDDQQPGDHGEGGGTGYFHFLSLGWRE
ncbi:hypothetical protein XAC2852_450024 [Xanthomonas citri pv. citri]|nr:hypothetical protein XAC2852_450024 [Xanthomonas citri pv. citri]